MFLSRYDATFILTQLFSSLLEHAKVLKDISTVVGLIWCDTITVVLTKKMGEFGGQNAHSTLNTDCELGV